MFLPGDVVVDPSTRSTVTLVSEDGGRWTCSDGVTRDELTLCPGALSSWTLAQLLGHDSYDLKYVPKDAEVDWRGHAPDEERFKGLRAVMEAKGDLSEWKAADVGRNVYCTTCLNWHSFETNYVAVRSTFPCPGPPKERKYLLDVPSGEIVFLHSVHGYGYEHFRNPRGVSNGGAICPHEDSELVYEDWQANQAAFGVVPICTSVRPWDGHNSDAVVRSTGTRVVVARAPVNLGRHQGYHIPEPHEVSLVDEVRFRTLKGRVKRDTDSPEEARLRVEPGLYEVTVSRRRSDPKSRGYWAVARRVGPPMTPSPDYEPAPKSPMHPSHWAADLADGNPEHYFGVSPYPRTWDASPPEIRYRAWARVVFEDLHLKDGFSYTNQRYWEASGGSSSVAEAVPRFRERLHWHDDVNFDPSTVPPEMVELVVRVLESLVSFGAHRDGVPEAALSHLRQLYDAQPGVADPAYVRWMGEPGRAEAWVATINARMEATHPELDIFLRMRV